MIPFRMECIQRHLIFVKGHFLKSFIFLGTKDVQLIKVSCIKVQFYLKIR